MVHSVLVNKSKSSSEKSTGLSRELCRLGDKHVSPAKNASSGRTDDDEDEDEEAAAVAAAVPGFEVCSPGMRAELSVVLVELWESSGCGCGCSAAARL